jgi:hypothetical protein
MLGIEACKESMWEEYMIQQNWTERDFHRKSKSKLIRQERARFDLTMEKYSKYVIYCLRPFTYYLLRDGMVGRVVQSQVSLRTAIETNLGWKAPNELVLTQVQREALGEDADDDNDNIAEATGDETEDCIVSDSDDEEQKYGKIFRRAQFFCAFKGDGPDNDDNWF